MSNDFDFFLILSVLAILFVLWLLIRSFKTQPKTKEPSINTEKKKAVRIERIHSKAQSTYTSPTDIKPKKPRVMGFLFLLNDKSIFAYVRVSSVGAQAWGDETIEIKTPLLRFIKRFLRTEDQESLLIDVIREVDPASVLSAQAIDEKGMPLSEPSPVGLKAGDFPMPQPIYLKQLKRWTVQSLTMAYHSAFYRSSAAEMALLMKAENNFVALKNTSFDSKAFLLSAAYLILIALINESDYPKRSQLWNQYWGIIEQDNFRYTEQLDRLERLVISQTFVQTQKLPFLLMRTSTSSGKCYNALNY